MTRRSTGCLASALLAALISSGCRPDERGRPLHFTPGVYQGAAVPALTADQIKQLEARGNLLR
jgi:hypothetical protein